MICVNFYVRKNDEMKHTAITLEEMLESLRSDIAKLKKLAGEKKPDIVLLDINMPKNNGLEVLRKLVPEMRGTGFIMISGNDDENVARDCLTYGAFDYVSKPLNLDVLEKVITSRLLPR